MEQKGSQEGCKGRERSFFTRLAEFNTAIGEAALRTKIDTCFDRQVVVHSGSSIQRAMTRLVAVRVFIRVGFVLVSKQRT